MQECWLSIRRDAYDSSREAKGTGALTNDVENSVMMGIFAAEEDMDAMVGKWQVCKRNNKGTNLQGV